MPAYTLTYHCGGHSRSQRTHKLIKTNNEFSDGSMVTFVAVAHSRVGFIQKLKRMNSRMSAECSYDLLCEWPNVLQGSQAWAAA
jgi:hypothetical protein